MKYNNNNNNNKWQQPHFHSSVYRLQDMHIYKNDIFLGFSKSAYGAKDFHKQSVAMPLITTDFMKIYHLLNHIIRAMECRQSRKTKPPNESTFGSIEEPLLENLIDLGLVSANDCCLQSCFLSELLS